MIWNKCQMRLTNWQCRRKTQVSHVRRVVFGDQLIFGLPFALCYCTVVCLSVCQSSLSVYNVGGLRCISLGAIGNAL